MTTNAMPIWFHKFGPPVALAVITGGIAMFGTVAILEEKLSQCQANLERIERSVEVIKRDIYAPRWGHQP